MRFTQTCLPTLVALLVAGNAFAQTSALQPPQPPSIQGTAGPSTTTLELPAIDGPLKLVSLTIVLVEASASNLPDDKSPEELLPLIAKLARENQLTGHTRLQLSTADGQPGFVQNGEQVSVSQSTARVDGRGVVQRSVSRQSVGTIVRCTPRVVEGAVVASLDIEDSRLVPAPRPMGAPEEPVAESPPSMQTTVARSIVTIPTGRTVVVGGQQTITPDGKSRQSLILVTAKVLD